MNTLIGITTDDLQELIEAAVANAMQKTAKPNKQLFDEFADLVTIREVAAMCRVCIATVNNWIRDGRLKRRKQGRVVRFAKQDVIDLIKGSPKYKRV